jgi:glutaminase
MLMIEYDEETLEGGRSPRRALINAGALVLTDAIEKKNEERIIELGQYPDEVYTAYCKSKVQGKMEVAEEIRRRFPDIVDGVEKGS